MSSKVIIKINKGGLQNQKFTFDQKESIILGRGNDCSIILTDPAVSRYHCLLDIAPPSVMVRDLNSLNGTFLNGKKIRQHETDRDSEKKQDDGIFMKAGDRLQLGQGCEIILDITNEESGQKTQKPNGCTESEIAGYQRIDNLGKGNMGEVWLVKKGEKGRKKALKLMLSQVAADEDMRKLFLREAYTAGQLKHKNIVRQYACGYSGDTYYILMEYCRNKNVWDLTRSCKDKRLNPKLATEIILQVLDGLDYAHHVEVKVKLANGEIHTPKGIVHRDLKPANILLTGDLLHPTVKIGDFGLAKAFETAGLSGHTHTDQFYGAPMFICRQQILNYRYAEPEVDVWAAAAVYYFMLTGFPPKDFETNDFVIEALNNKAVPILSHKINIPRKLADVIDAALVEEPQIGIRTVSEFKSRIEESL